MSPRLDYDHDYDNDNGDAVIFNDTGANTNPIAISGTVAPGLKTFANTATRFYRLDNGTLAGTGNLVVSGGGNVRRLRATITVDDWKGFSS